MSVDHSSAVKGGDAAFLHVRPGHFVIVGGDATEKDDWWTLQRKQEGQKRAKEREARLQREREERGEDQKVRNRLHWEEMRRAAQDNSGQS